MKGKSALIVGGTRGVGYGTALALAKSGASRVTIVGRSKESGATTVSAIQSELGNKSTTNIKYLQGDIGTVASTQRLLDKLVGDDTTRYDYLVVTAAIFPLPKSRNPSPLNVDGIEKSFAIGVVGRFLLYRKAHAFMKKPDNNDNESPMILNVCASGGNMHIGFDRKLAQSLAFPHMLNIVNFAIGNELSLHKLVQKRKTGNSDGTPFRIPIITTHPGYLKTDLHRGQGILLDVAETIMVHFMGCTEEECGRRQVSLLCAIGSKEQPSPLTIVDNFGYGRRINSGTEYDLKEHGDWLWDLLLKLEAGKTTEH